MTAIPLFPNPFLLKPLLNSMGIFKRATRSGHLSAISCRQNRKVQTHAQGVAHQEARNLYLLGVEKLRQQDFSQAIEKFNEALKLNPSLARAYNDRGVAFYQMGKKHLAIKDFNTAIELNPNYAKFYRNRGFARHRLGDKAGAIDDYNRSLLFNPKCAKTYFNRGVVRYQMADQAGALADFNMTLRLNPNHTKAFYNRAVIQAHLAGNSDLLISEQ